MEPPQLHYHGEPTPPTPEELATQEKDDFDLVWTCKPDGRRTIMSIRWPPVTSPDSL